MYLTRIGNLVVHKYSCDIVQYKSIQNLKVVSYIHSDETNLIQHSSTACFHTMQINLAAVTWVKQSLFALCLIKRV